MADAEREHSYYHPGGVPVTPQARRFGFEFPVYVSKAVFGMACIAEGIASKHNTHTEKRIWELLESCYAGLGKKLAVSDDFIYFGFKHYYWGRTRYEAKKQIKGGFGARLLLDPSTNGPWLYIFAPRVDDIDVLVKGQPPITSSAGIPIPDGPMEGSDIL